MTGKGAHCLGDARGLASQSDRELRTLRRRAQELEAQCAEQQAAIRELQANERRYRRLVEGVRLIGWEYNRAEKRFTFVSHHAEDILGYSIEQWTQPEFWFNHLHPDDRDQAIAFSHRRVAAGEDHEFEYRMIAADGAAVWFRDITTVAHDAPDGHRLHGVLIDITARKRLEHALMSVTAAVAPVVGEEFFRTLVLELARSLGVSYAHIAVLDDDATITTLAACHQDAIVDNRTISISGMPCEHVLRESGTCIHPKGVQRVFPGQAVFEQLGADSYAGVPVRNSAGDVVGMLVVVDTKPLVDVDFVRSLLQVFASRIAVELERMDTEAELRESQQRLQTIAEYIPGVAYTYDKQEGEPRQLVFMGPGLSGLVGPGNAARVEQCLDELFELVHPDDRVALAVDVEAAIRTGSVVHRNMRVRTDSGSYRWIRSASRPSTLEDGRVRWHVVLIDIDRETRAEHVLQTLAEETSGVVGQDFFASLVERLARTLEVRHVLIGQHLEHGRRLRTLAFWKGDQLADNIGFELLGSPSERIAAGHTLCVPRDVRASFPSDRLLRSLDADGYCGIPLHDTAGSVIGQMLLVHDGPIDPELHKLPALNISASRVSAELQRLRTERALRRSQDHLRIMIEQMPAMMWTTDARLVFTSSTGRGLGDLGFVPGQTNGISVYDFFADDESGLLAIRMHERALRRESVNFENTYAGRIYQNHIEPLIDTTGSVIGTIGVALDISELKHSNRRLELLMRELDHRVRNNLATLASIAQQTATMTDSVPEFLESFTGRLAAMSMAHGVLAETRTGAVDLRTVLWRLLAPHVQEQSGRAELLGPNVDLPSAVAFPLCLSVHELVTNAAKHGAFSNDAGRLTVEWSLQHRDSNLATLLMNWSEHDGPLVEPPGESGFGTSVINGLIHYQLRGSVETRFDPSGFTCSMVIPLHPDRDEHGDHDGKP